MKIASESLHESSESIQKLEVATAEELENLRTARENLEKVNRNLQEQANNYAIQFKEEQVEKKLRIGKYNELNDKYLEKVEEWAQRSIVHRRVVFGLVAALCIVIAVGATIWILKS